MSTWCVIYYVLLSWSFKLAAARFGTRLSKWEEKQSGIGGKDENFPFTTVVDVLSSDVQFSNFVEVIQRAGYVPYLNELDNFTLIAPVNSAFVLSATEIENFNIEDYIIYGEVLDLKASLPGLHILVSGTRPFAVRAGKKGHSSIQGVKVVVEDLSPNMQNARIQGVASLMDVPMSYQEVFNVIRRDFPDLGVETAGFLLHELCMSTESVLTNKTLVLPTDECFRESLNEVELNYLLRAWSDDSHNWSEDSHFLARKLVLDGIHGGILSGRTVNSANGELVELASSTDGEIVSVNGTAAGLSNAVYNSGVIHLLPHVQHLQDGIEFTAAKYLVGLNATGFVNELYLRELNYLVDSSDKAETIFIARESDGGTGDFSKSGLLYHFIDGAVRLDQEFDSTGEDMVKTRMYNSIYCASNKRLGGNCQRIKISKIDGELILNNRLHIINHVPYEVNGKLIYVVEGAMELPGEIVPSVGTLFHCSKSLILLQQAGLLDLRSNNRGYTVLLPCFGSWEDQGLHYDYLLAKTDILQELMGNFIFNDLIYTDTTSEELKDTTNLRGQKATVNLTDRDVDHGTRHLELSTLAGHLEIDQSKEILFNEGVIHPISQVLYPKSFRISLENLIDTVGNAHFRRLLGSIPFFQDIVTGNISYSLLLPSAPNLIHGEGDFDDSRELEDFLKLHTIPNDFVDALYNCNGTIETLLGYSLSCREILPGNYMLRIVGGRDNEIRVLKRGCTVGTDNRSCIFVVDRPFSLSWKEKERYHLQLPGLSFALGLILGIISLFLLLVGVVTLSNSKRLQRNDIISEVNDEEAAAPLIRQEHEQLNVSQNDTYGSIEGPSTVRQGYEDSSNTSTNPIRGSLG